MQKQEETRKKLRVHGRPFLSTHHAVAFFPFVVDFPDAGFDRDLVADVDAFFVVDFTGAAAFFGAAFLVAAALALDAGVVPVTAFFADPLVLEVFFFVAAVDVDALALPTTVFLVVAAAFFTGAFFAGAALVAFAGAAALAMGFFVVFAAGLVAVLDAVLLAGLVADLDAGLVAVLDAGLAADLEAGLVAVFETGLEFSLESEALTLGASLTLPEGPLGRTNTLPSTPDEIALFNW